MRLLTTVLVILAPVTLFAQGEFLEGTQSGGGFGVSVSGSDGVTGYFGTFGYSFKGVSDVSAFIGFENGGGENQSFGGGQLSFWLLKEGRKRNPLSLSLFGAFESHERAKAYGFGSWLSKRVNIENSRAFFVPAIGVSYMKLDRDYYFSGYSSYGGDANVTAGLGSVALAFPLHAKGLLAFSLGAAVSSDNTTVTGGVALVFGK